MGEQGQTRLMFATNAGAAGAVGAVGTANVAGSAGAVGTANAAGVAGTTGTIGIAVSQGSNGAGGACKPKAQAATSPIVQQVLCRAEAALRQYFGHSGLREFQRDAVAAWAEGRDVVVTLATGAGKSLCFQLPALICEAPRSNSSRWVLVISPLVALMQDQVRTLRQRQIKAALCGSGASSETAATWPALAAGAFSIVYMCPEFAMGHLERLAQMRSSVCLLAVDEAHCVSSWGHDFRPQYRELGRLRQALAGVPVMCATATCTPEVRADIVKSLQLSANAVHVNGHMNRSNLKYLVQKRTSLVEDLGVLFGAELSSPCAAEARRGLAVDNTVVGPTSSAIIYVPTKARCEEIAAWLQARGVAAVAYHAGLHMGVRHAAHRDFITDVVQVVVATVAFGMGIDKPSIRRIVHYGAVQTLEHYVQQCGRAGRDGEEAECVAFVRPDEDATEARNLIVQDFRGQTEGQARCQRMLALNTELTMYLKDESNCRRVRLLHHFGESPAMWSQPGDPPRGECIMLAEGRAICHWCDVCLSGAARSTPAGSEDFTRECRIFLQCVNACGGMTGAAVPCLVAAGHGTNKQVTSKRLDRHKAFGSGNFRPLQWWKDLLPHLRQSSFLEEKAAVLANGMKYVALSVSKQGQQFLTDQSQRFVLKPVPKELATSAPVAAATVTVRPGTAATPARATGEARVVRAPAVLPASDHDLYRRLCHVRIDWQRKAELPGECLVSNAALKSFANVRPSSLEAAQHLVEYLPSTLNVELLRALVDESRRFCEQHSLQADVGGGAQNSLKADPGAWLTPAKRLRNTDAEQEAENRQTAAHVDTKSAGAALKQFQQEVENRQTAAHVDTKSAGTLQQSPWEDPVDRPVSPWLGRKMSSSALTSGSCKHASATGHPPAVQRDSSFLDEFRFGIEKKVPPQLDHLHSGAQAKAAPQDSLPNAAEAGPPITARERALAQQADLQQKLVILKEGRFPQSAISAVEQEIANLEIPEDRAAVSTASTRLSQALTIQSKSQAMPMGADLRVTAMATAAGGFDSGRPCSNGSAGVGSAGVGRAESASSRGTAASIFSAASPINSGSALLGVVRSLDHGCEQGLHGNTAKDVGSMGSASCSASNGSGGGGLFTATVSNGSGGLINSCAPPASGTSIFRFSSASGTAPSRSDSIFKAASGSASHSAGECPDTSSSSAAALAAGGSAASTAAKRQQQPSMDSMQQAEASGLSQSAPADAKRRKVPWACTSYAMEDRPILGEDMPISLCTAAQHQSIPAATGHGEPVAVTAMRTNAAASKEEAVTTMPAASKLGDACDNCRDRTEHGCAQEAQSDQRGGEALLGAAQPDIIGDDWLDVLDNL